MNHELSAAVAAAYQIFARYDFVGADESDSEWIGPLERRVLRLTPPAELPADLVAAYIADVTSAAETPAAADFRAVLPRLLELVAAGVVPASDAVGALRRAEYAARWPAIEVAAVTRLFAALPGSAAREPAHAGSG